jgi:hypothetical protein
LTKGDNKMTVLEQINKDFDTLSNNYASGNAHGIPITKEGSLTLLSLNDLKFNEKIIITDKRCSKVLIEIAEILSCYF